MLLSHPLLLPTLALCSLVVGGAEPFEVFPYVIPGSSTCNNSEDPTVLIPRNEGETDQKRDPALIIGPVVGGGELGVCKQLSGVYWNTGMTIL